MTQTYPILPVQGETCTSDSEQDDPDSLKLFIPVQSKTCTSDSEQDDPDCHPLLPFQGRICTSLILNKMTQTASNLSSLLKVRLAHVSDSEQNDPDCHPLLTVQGRICTSDSEQDDPDCFPLLYAHGNTYTSDSEQDDPVFGILFCANFSFSRMPWLPSSTRIPPTSSSSTLKMTLMWRQHRF